MFSLQMNMVGKLNLLILLLVTAFGEGKPVRKLKRPHEQKERSWNWDDDDDCLEDKAPRNIKHLPATDDQDELTDILSEQRREARHSNAELYNSELDFEYDEVVVKTVIRLRVHNDDYHMNDDEGVDNFTDFDKISYNHQDIYDDYKLSLSVVADDNDDDNDGQIDDDDDDGDDDDDDDDFMDDEICERDDQFDNEICDDDDDDDDDTVEVDVDGDYEDGSQTHMPAIMFDADNFDIENDSDKPVLFQSFLV